MSAVYFVQPDKLVVVRIPEIVAIYIVDHQIVVTLAHTTTDVRVGPVVVWASTDKQRVQVGLVAGVYLRLPSDAGRGVGR